MAAAAKALAEALRPNFRVGTKELYLPNASITFLRSKKLPADQARFQVPLWFSKLDLRDYLWHVYNVRIFAVRSYVEQQRLQQGKTRYTFPQSRRWHRPRAHKYMTVTLERPFVWPEKPESFERWNKDDVEESDRAERRMAEEYAPTKDTLVNEDRRTKMREQAQALLDKTKVWKPAVKEDPQLLSQWR